MDLNVEDTLPSHVQEFAEITNTSGFSLVQVMDIATAKTISNKQQDTANQAAASMEPAIACSSIRKVVLALAQLDIGTTK